MLGDIAGNTINGKITFFEDNTDRRAYCKAVAGRKNELLFNFCYTQIIL